MTEKQSHIEQIKEIRSIMERSSSFISLSGLSGVFAGIFALFGAAFAYWYLYVYFPDADSAELLPKLSLYSELLAVLSADAGLVLLFALAFGFFFTYRNSKRKGLKMWDNTAKRLVINLMLPLAVGGAFSIILIWQGVAGIVASTTLIFYGLALINASKYTLHDIRYLGVSEVVIGLLAAIYIGYGLVFWAVGFGLLHIIYGTFMFLKYENGKSA